MAVVAEVVATVVPGPIGTAAGFISAGAYLATGNTEKATEMAITATAQLIGAGLAAKAAVKAVQYASKIGRAVTGAVKSARAAVAESRVGRAAERILSKGCNCFIAGTLVDTDHGPVPIEDIQVGDQVWARDLDTGTNELRDVVGLFNKQAAALETITVTDGTQVVVTEEHPFYVDGEGWVLSGDLHVGDHLAQRNHTTTTITNITRSQRVVTVYNFEVTGDHNYYITTAQLLVHNCAVIPGNPFRGPQAPKEAFKHLERFHGLDPHVASNRLHVIKKKGGLRANDNVTIGRTGDVYDPRSGARLDSLTNKGLGTKR